MQSEVSTVSAKSKPTICPPNFSCGFNCKLSQLSVLSNVLSVLFSIPKDVKITCGDEKCKDYDVFPSSAPHPFSLLTKTRVSFAK